MTIGEALKSLTAYPVPASTLANVAQEAGIELQAQADAPARAGRGYKKAQALICLFLAEAPNVSQGGISYSLGEDERVRLRRRAEAILCDIGDNSTRAGTGGYIGEDL